MSLLADGLVEAGHDVTLFASGDSRTKARLVASFPEAPSTRIGEGNADLLHALECYVRADEFDVVNDHSGPLAATVGGLLETAFVHTVHGPLVGEPGELYERIAAVAPRLALVSLSLNQRKPLPGLPWVANCPNALNLDAYPAHIERGEYLLFLGRMSPEKGCHRAIDVAREAGMPLKIAGKKRMRLEQEYFDTVVRPRLGDGIEYLGETSHVTKVALLQNARATLFPIEWEEPFGLVMIESMACGTPIIATRRGAVPKVIEHGRSGIVVDDYREMSAAIRESDKLDPRECRRYVEERFSAERMVRDYEAVYERVLERVAA